MAPETYLGTSHPKVPSRASACKLAWTQALQSITPQRCPMQTGLSDPSTSSEAERWLLNHEIFLWLVISGTGLLSLVACVVATIVNKSMLIYLRIFPPLPILLAEASQVIGMHVHILAVWWGIKLRWLSGVILMVEFFGDFWVGGWCP